MSDAAAGKRRDGPWLQAVARSRGIDLSDDRAAELAAAAAATLGRFDALVGELAVDDDIDDFRRLLDAGRERA
jgi:hypothetical protein